ncbi:MAG: type II toxin-antitoxin system RelE/ParE family toxin [Anaerolineae bacterium]|nr:type II toxin-antitoxin system RelE/ParE family toxin [Anaerolineae bacterium]
MDQSGKPLLILHGEIRTPPMSREARVEAGYLLRQLQDGVLLSLPHSRPMPSIGNRCHELRIPDKGVTWRIIYRNDPDAIIILEIFAKKTDKTPQKVIDTCKRRLQLYDS